MTTSSSEESVSAGTGGRDWACGAAAAAAAGLGNVPSMSPMGVGQQVDTDWRWQGATADRNPIGQDIAQQVVEAAEPMVTQVDNIVERQGVEDLQGVGVPTGHGWTGI